MPDAYIRDKIQASTVSPYFDPTKIAEEYRGGFIQAGEDDRIVARFFAMADRLRRNYLHLTNLISY